MIQTISEALALFDEVLAYPWERTVVYQGNGPLVSEVPPPDDGPWNRPLYLTMAVPRRSGFRFVSWNTRPDGWGGELAARRTAAAGGGQRHALRPVGERVGPAALSPLLPAALRLLCALWVPSGGRLRPVEPIAPGRCFARALFSVAVSGTAPCSVRARRAAPPQGSASPGRGNPLDSGDAPCTLPLHQTSFRRCKNQYLQAVSPRLTKGPPEGMIAGK